MMFHVKFLPDLIYKNFTGSTVLTLNVTTSRAGSGWPTNQDSFLDYNILIPKLSNRYITILESKDMLAACVETTWKTQLFLKTAWISAQVAQAYPGFCINTCQLKSIGNMKVVWLQLSEL